MIRTAISPRFAIRTRPNGGDVTGTDRLCTKTVDAYSGMLPCFFRGFVSRLSDSIASARINRGRVSDGLITSSMYPRAAAMYGFANSASYSDTRRRPHGDRISGGGQFFLGDDVHRARSTHDRDLCGRPGEVHVAADVFAAHDVIGTAIGLARDDGQLRDRCLGVREQQLGAVPDDAAMFLADTRQESRARRRTKRAGC